MNNELKRDLKVAKLWYYNFRYSIYFPIFLPSVAAIVCLIVIFAFVLPQIQSWFSLQDEIKATEGRIQTIKDNISYLQVVDGQTVDADFHTATLALPAEKDFMGILNVISDAASSSNVALQDYSFTPPSVTKKNAGAATTTTTTDPSTVGMTPVRVSLVVEGKIGAVNDFVNNIEKKLPLAEVKEVDFGETKAQIVINFYTRSFPDITLANGDTINVLNQSDRILLQKLRTQSASE